MPAQATANSVIASAKRLIEVRHSWRKSRRMAEISVPAWPMPIHQTKLMIAKPQPAGRWRRQRPTPWASSQVTAVRNIISPEKAAAKPTSHHCGVCLVRMTSLILSVTVPAVWPGATIGAWSGFTVAGSPGLFSSVAMLSSLGRVRLAQRGARIAQLREIGGARARVDVLEQPVVERIGLQLRHLRLRVVDVAEDDRPRRAALLAGGLEPVRRDRLMVDLGLDLRRLDALHTVGALLHHAAHAHRHVRVVDQLQHRRALVAVAQEVEAAPLVGAVVRAVAGAHATVVDHVVEPLVAVHGGGHRADHLAGRVLALHAGQGLVVERGGLVQRPLPVAVDAQPVQLAAGEDLALGPRRDVVLRLAALDAGAAAGADAQVDRHPPGVAV